MPDSQPKQVKKPNGTYIYKNFWCTADGYTTDGDKVAHTGGFISSTRWLMDECGLSKEGLTELWSQRELDGVSA